MGKDGRVDGQIEWYVVLVRICLWPCVHVNLEGGGLLTPRPSFPVAFVALAV